VVDCPTIDFTPWAAKNRAGLARLLGNGRAAGPQAGEEERSKRD